MTGKQVTVTELTEYIKGLLEEDVFLQRTLVIGELSKFKIHSSGHCYFSLKD